MSGRVEHRNSHEGRVRKPRLGQFYGGAVTDVRPGAYTFRIQQVRDDGSLASLDRLVEEFDWADDAATLSGNLTLLRQDPDDPSAGAIGVGQRIRCEVRTQGSWYRLWQMRTQPYTTTLEDGRIAVPVIDDLVGLSRNKRKWSYRKTKRRPKGWLPQEIVADAARREGIRIGVLAKGTHRITRLVKKSSFLQVIIEAYSHEREKSGRRFVIRMRNGRLDVIPLRRNPILYQFRDQIEAASLELTQAQRPVTVIKGKGHIGKGPHAKKVRYTEYRRAIVTRFGKFTDERDYGKVDDLADLKSKVKRDYAKAVKIKRKATITVPLVPFLRRGDGCQWVTREPGWHGSSADSRDRSFVYATAVRHAVSATSQTTELDLTQDDPYYKDAVRLDKELRAKARARRKRQHS